MDEAAANSASPEQNNASNSSQTERNQAVREIHKNGWLKRYPSVQKKTSIFSKPVKLEPQWVVFCIHDDTNPFLELYESRRGACSHKPMTIIPLSKCLHLSPSLMMQDNQYIFTVALQSTAIRFAAASREQMNDWIDTIKLKLIDLNIFMNKENIYSEEPMTKPRPPVHQSLARSDSNPSPHSSLNTSIPSGSRESPSASSRNPASPLPSVPTQTPSSSGEEASVPNQGENDEANGTGVSESDIYSNISNVDVTSSQSSNITVIQVENQPSVFNFENLSLPDDSGVPVTPQSAPVGQSRFYDQAYDASVPSTPQSAPVGQSQFYDQVFDSNSNTQLQIQNPSYENHELQRHRRHSASETSNSAATVSALPARSPQVNGTTSQDPPRQLTLKEQQVMKLQREITHRGGIRINLRKRDCLNGIAFVECFGVVWVAGWKQREHPFLHDTFHIGDRLVSVQGIQFRSLQEAIKLVKRQILQVELILRRVPLGVVIAIKREYEGQDLGIVREGNTAEIKEVIRGGLSARHGLPLHAQSCEDSTKSCKWVLTEINNRPLNLFYRDGEIESRLNAVGKDISILVQPSDLIKALKKQLKSMRSFKEYIVQ